MKHVVVTPAALEAIQESGQSCQSFLERHVRRDESLGLRLLSAFKTIRGRWVWIITEADRRSTAIMLPSEYRRPPISHKQWSTK
jgi:hypothetical protein